MVQADTLTVTNGATVSASTFGNGDAGNVQVTASDRVTISGISATGFSSGIFTASFSFSQAGNIVITTPQLHLDNIRCN
jgi:hypothetical protein